MTPLAIETRKLNFSFDGRRKIIENLSLEVPEQSIYGFLGPNGAGKTTTIRLLTGMLPLESDQVFIHGQSVRKNIPGIFNGIGCLIETPSLYGHLTGRENLRIIALLRGLPAAKIDHVLKTVGLHFVASRKVKHYSLGMKQRLGIAMALLPGPQLLILDEPVNGLDPNGMREIRELLIRLNREEGKTIFISSHLLNEVEKTCTHIGIIHQGRLRYQGTLEQMKASAWSSGEVIFKISGVEKWISQVNEQFPQAKLQSAEELVMPFADPGEVSWINYQLVHMNIPVNGIQVRGGLEEWFMKIVENEKQIT